MKTEGDTVLNICLHALENLPCDLDGADNGAQSRCKEDDISGSLEAMESASLP